ncbi:MAG: HTH domain-containing protein [Halobacteriales archaeon]|nr:HTH domain-containing protein [Halobacteriales archaeon]
MAATDELLPLFARREQLLEQLQGGTPSKAALADRLPISRSTVDRSIRSLTTAGIVQRKRGGYQLTLTGRLLYQEYRSYRRRVAALTQAQQLLSALPTDTDIPPEAIVGSSVTYPEPTAPYRPMERHVEMIQRADEIDLLATTVAPRFIDAYESQVLAGELELRAGLISSVAERVVTNYNEPATKMLESGRLTLQELKQQPPFSFTIIRAGDQEFFSLLIYGSEGLNGYLVNERPAAIQFARELFDSYWQETTPLRMQDSRVSS